MSQTQRLTIQDAATKGAISIMGIGTARPPLVLTQQEIADFILNHFTIADRTKTLYKRVLSHPSIATRHFALDSLSEVLERDHDRINARYNQWAVRLSTEALNNALDKAAVLPDELNFLAVTTCTGYICPGLSSYVVETAHLRKDIHHLDVVGMGCGAALPALEQAAMFVSTHEGSSAAVVSTEISSAALFSNDSPDIVISNSLFADGSSAVVIKNRSGKGRPSAPVQPRLISFASRLYPEWRETLRFRTENGYLRNVLAKTVPDQSAKAVRDLVDNILRDAGLKETHISRWIVHSGGDKILNAVDKALQLPALALTASREVLRKCGNLSSASLFFILEQNIKNQPPKRGEWGLMVSFGAGFSAYAALVQFE